MTHKTEAALLDVEFPSHRDEFVIPTFKSLGVASPDFAESDDSIYFCGNSLGLMPKTTRKAINDELDAWGQRAVESHFDHPGENKAMWMDIDLPLVPLLAKVVGAHQNEVAAMGSLTANLNALLVAFYRPEGRKTKILFEKQAFPSDYYAFLNMVKLHGFDESHLVQLEIPENSTYLHTSYVLEQIEANKDDLALVCLPGIQYYTGQLFDIAKITAAARKHNVIVGWDLAHAVGNVPLQLHEWNVDFAVWCSYKYLNAGPGGIGGIYVHERHTKDNAKDHFTPRLAGWWGNDAGERFKMLESFDPIRSALSYRQSNPSVIDCVALRASLECIERAGGVETLRKKSVQMTNFMEKLLTSSKYYIPQSSTEASLGFKILSPLNENERGSQLSLFFQPHHDDKSKNVMERVNTYLHEHAIICDERRPDVLRLAPVPMYNTFGEVRIVVERLIEAMEIIARE